MRSRRVLVIEDNIDSARTLVRVLKAEGHQAEYAINGHVGVAMAKVLRPEVVILDLGLPGMNGYQVCGHLKREDELKKAKIIVVSGYAKDEDRKRSAAAGCDAHLAKPADLQQLLALVSD